MHNSYNKGPWKAFSLGDVLSDIYTADAVHPIAMTVNNTNANLIAAAPDLLAACEAVLANCIKCRTWKECDIHSHGIVRKAVAKAQRPKMVEDEDE